LSHRNILGIDPPQPLERAAAKKKPEATAQRSAARGPSENQAHVPVRKPAVTNVPEGKACDESARPDSKCLEPAATEGRHAIQAAEAQDRATSSRNTGRLQIGTVGDIGPKCLADIIGIRT